MNEKILIAYASKTGATAKYAGFIAGDLIARGFMVSQINLRETKKPDISQYNIILLGTGVRIGRLYGPVKKALKMKDIKNKQIGVFISCGMAMDSTKVQEAIEKYIDPILIKYNLDAFSKIAFPGTIPGTKEELVIDAELVRSWTEVINGKFMN